MEKEKERIKIPLIEYQDKMKNPGFEQKPRSPHPPLESNTDTQYEEDQEYDGESEYWEGEEDVDGGEYFQLESGMRGYYGADGKLYYMRSDGEYYKYDINEEEFYEKFDLIHRQIFSAACLRI